MVPSKYRYEQDVEYLIYYVLRPWDCALEGVGGSNILHDPNFDLGEIADEFMIIQKHFSGSRRVYHFIISFDYEPVPKINELWNIGKRICNLFPYHQSVFGVHTDCSIQKTHLHVVINNCPIFPEEAETLTNMGDILSRIYLEVEKYTLLLGDKNVMT